MKKTLFVMAVAAMLVFAVAGSAFAASGQDRQGSAVTTQGVVSPFALALKSPPQTNPVAGAGTYTYMNWGTAMNLGTNSGDLSPHGKYTTTTVKCVVCHAVHYAAPGMAPVSSGNQDADTLLRAKASEACILCHATAGFAVNGAPVYEEGVDSGHVIGQDCNECHTGPHAAGADDSVASLAGFLLKKQTVDPWNGTQEVVTTTILQAAQVIDDLAVSQGFNSGDAFGYTPVQLAGLNTADARTHSVGIYCAECHFGAYTTFAPGAATNVNGQHQTNLLSGHRVGETVVGSTSWNSNGEISSGLTDIGQVAWAPATTCTSCHDALSASGFSGFPHSWGVNSPVMWLKSADDVTTAKTNVTVANGFDATVPQLSDGVCLKCHVGDAANGVGITF